MMRRDNPPAWRLLELSITHLEYPFVEGCTVGIEVNLAYEYLASRNMMYRQGDVVPVI